MKIQKFLDVFYLKEITVIYINNSGLEAPLPAPFPSGKATGRRPEVGNDAFFQSLSLGESIASAERIAKRRKNLNEKIKRRNTDG